MPAVIRNGFVVATCDACGSAIAPFRYVSVGERSRWYCREHRAAGDAWLAEIRQHRLAASPESL